MASRVCLGQESESMRSPLEQAQGDSQVMGSTDQLRSPLSFPVLLDRFLTSDEVCQIVSLSKPQVYKLVRRGTFPRHVHIGSASRWSLREVEQWVADQLARRSA